MYRDIDIFNKAEEYIKNGDWVSALRGYCNYFGKKQDRLSEEQIICLHKIAELSSQMNWHNQSMFAYKMLSEIQEITEKEIKEMNRILNIHMLPPKPSMMTMKEIIEDPSSTVGIRAKNTKGIDLFHGLGLFANQHLNCPLEPNYLTNDKLQQIKDALEKYGFLELLKRYRIYLINNGINNKVTPSLWYLVADKVVSPQPGDENENQYSLYSLMGSLHKLLSNEDKSCLNFKKEDIVGKLNQLNELIKIFHDSFKSITIRAMAEQERDDNFGNLNLKTSYLPWGSLEEWRIPGGRALFRALFQNSDNALAKNISLSLQEVGEGNEKWLLISLLGDDSGFPHSVWETLNLDRLRPSDIAQGSSLKWVVIVVKALGGEVIIHSNEGGKSWMERVYSTGTGIPDHLLEKAGLSMDITKGTKITLALPLFRN